MRINWLTVALLVTRKHSSTVRNSTPQFLLGSTVRVFYEDTDTVLLYAV